MVPAPTSSRARTASPRSPRASARRPRASRARPSTAAPSTSPTTGARSSSSTSGAPGAPCRAEASNLVKVAEDTADQGVQFVGLNTRDFNKGPAIAFEKDYEVEYPSIYDPQGKQILRFPRGSLSPQAIPSTVVIDRDGKIAARTLQAVSEKQLRSMIDPVLAEK